MEKLIDNIKFKIFVHSLARQVKVTYTLTNNDVISYRVPCATIQTCDGIIQNFAIIGPSTIFCPIKTTPTRNDSFLLHVNASTSNTIDLSGICNFRDALPGLYTFNVGGYADLEYANPELTGTDDPYIVLEDSVSFLLYDDDKDICRTLDYYSAL